MILRNKNKKHVSDSINLIPMINLVFLLLIFFLLTGVVSKKESIKIIRPFSIYGLQNEIKEKELSFTVLGSQIFYDGKKITKSDLEKLYLIKKKFSQKKINNILRATYLKNSKFKPRLIN